MRKMDEKYPDSAKPAPMRVGIVPLPGFPLMSYASTVEPLRAANLLSKRRLYEICHFSDGTSSESSSGAHIAGDYAIGDLPLLDLLLIVAGGNPFEYTNTDLQAWLRNMATRVETLGGVSGGSVVLAQCGLMEGRRMTVHWEHAEALAEAYPSLLLERRIYVMDRDRFTCGGGTAPVDLMHALITQHHGPAFAQKVSDWFLHTDIRAATAPQRALPSSMLGKAPKPVVEAVAVMENHVADPVTLEQVAMMSGVSSRHLNRLFKENFSKSTMAFYRDLRLDVGRRLVTGSNLSLNEIADATGFATMAHFSNQYAQHFQVRPKQDRHRQRDGASG